MKNTLKINHAETQIVMDRTFAKLAENTKSDEYAHLQAVRQDYPNYTVIRRTIKKNSKRETYKGLTYAYMEKYIELHAGNDERRAQLLTELAEKRLISECHKQGHRYPTIKQWFLEQFPEIVQFGLPQTPEERSGELDVA